MSQRDILFWVFISFFILIGILSLLVSIGLLKADKKFRGWAVTGFVAGVGGAVFGLFKSTFAPVPLFVGLSPRPPMEARQLNLVGGEYRYDEPSSGKAVRTHKGQIEVSLGER